MHKHHEQSSSWVVIPVILLFTVVCIGGVGSLWYLRTNKLKEQMMLYERQAMMAQKAAQNARMQAEMARKIAEQELNAARRLQAQQKTAMESASKGGDTNPSADPLLPPLEALPAEP